MDETEAVLDHEDNLEQQELNEDIQTSQDDQLQEEYAETGSVPYNRKPDSLFSLFQKVWKSPDSSKVANLDKFELGKPDISVRDAQYLALLGATLKHRKFSSFFKMKGEITLSTSASKKGWFTELFVSQKKYTQRMAAFSSTPQEGGASGKWRLFGDKQKNQPAAAEE